MSTIIAPRPKPSHAAERGLRKLMSMEVSFAKGTATSSEDAALAHLDELMAWWSLTDVRDRDARHRRKGRNR